MQIKKKIRIEGLPDPFTLLKFSQAFREIGPGDQLEILYEGEGLPAELLKVMPKGGFTVITEQKLKDEPLVRIILEKKDIPAMDVPGGGCQCL